jgi:hypothetical protein
VRIGPHPYAGVLVLLILTQCTLPAIFDLLNIISIHVFLLRVIEGFDYSVVVKLSRFHADYSEVTQERSAFGRTTQATSVYLNSLMRYYSLS